jgi:hypothetical protein
MLRKIRAAMRAKSTGRGFVWCYSDNRYVSERVEEPT